MFQEIDQIAGALVKLIVDYKKARIQALQLQFLKQGGQIEVNPGQFEYDALYSTGILIRPTMLL